jgi:hypothetical protein
VDRRGHTTDVGKVPRWELREAVAGTISGDRFFVRASGAIYTVDINPASPAYLGVLDVSWLWPLDYGITVDDFDVNPADGLLYGVATHPWGHADVVTIDPSNGHVRATHTANLPDGPGYGAAVFGPDGALYATNNDEGGHSVLYRIALDGGGAVTKIATRGAVREIDAAGCLSTPPPATSPPRSETPPVVPPQVPPAAPTTVPPTPNPAAVPPPPPVLTTTTTTTTTSAPPPPKHAAQPIDRPKAVAVAAADNKVRDLRRWSLTVLLMVLGTGAVAGRHAARRRRAR